MRDGSGNPMAVYKQVEEWVNGKHFRNTYLLENTLYGSKRLGTADYGNSRLVASIPLQGAVGLPTHPTDEYNSERGYKRYELSNHLGNVLAVVSDMVNGHDNGGTADYYAATVISASDYYPYGWVISDRKYVDASGGHRYGFNGQEQDAEWRGGQAVSFRFRIHDPRLGKFLSVDPLAPEYPWNSSYAFAENSVIMGMDLEGAELLSKNSVIFDSSPELKTMNSDEGGFDEMSDATLTYYWKQQLAIIFYLNYNDNQRLGSDGEYYYYTGENLYYDKLDGKIGIKTTGMEDKKITFNAEDEGITVSPVNGVPLLAPTMNGKRTRGSRLHGAVYGYGRSRLHDGIDISAEPGEDLYSIRSGKVIQVVSNFTPGQYRKDSYGNYVVVETTLPDGTKIALKYNHLDRVDVEEGQTIEAGTQIGLAGKTGNAADYKSGKKRIGYYHVHIQARIPTKRGNYTWKKSEGKRNGTIRNPEEYINFEYDPESGSRSPIGFDPVIHNE